MFQALEGVCYIRDHLLPYCRALIMKRIRVDEDNGSSPTKKKARIEEETDTSEAAKFNDRVLRKLQRAFAADPEDDLLANFPTGYSARLAGRKEQVAGE